MTLSQNRKFCLYPLLINHSRFVSLFFIVFHLWVIFLWYIFRCTGLRQRSWLTSQFNRSFRISYEIKSQNPRTRISNLSQTKLLPTSKLLPTQHLHRTLRPRLLPKTTTTTSSIPSWGCFEGCTWAWYPKSCLGICYSFRSLWGEVSKFIDKNIKL